MMDVLLVMFRDGGQHRPFKVTKETTVVGRREDCDLRIAVNDVSRKHCRLILDGDTIRVEDLGSSNGTFVNGQRIQTHALAAGDTLQVGPVSFIVQIDGEPVLGPNGAPARIIPKASSKAPNKTKEIDEELDELQILNDSGGDSGEIAFDPSEK